MVVEAGGADVVGAGMLVAGRDGGVEVELEEVEVGVPASGGQGDDAVSDAAIWPGAAILGAQPKFDNTVCRTPVLPSEKWFVAVTSRM